MAFFTASFDYGATGEGLTRAVWFFTVVGKWDSANMKAIDPTLEDARKRVAEHLGWFGKYADVHEGLKLDIDGATLIPEWAKKFIQNILDGDERPGNLDFEFKAHFNFS